jgi:hypothetical protein
MKTVCRIPALLLVLLLTWPGRARGETWRFFGGSFETDWHVASPPRGHKEDCRTRACDDRDLREGNLDRSIGYRAGTERPLLQKGRWEVFAGAELGVVFTEYNSSQRDVRIGEAFVVGGGRVDLGPLALLARVAGGGSAFDDGRAGFSHFLESAAEVPMSRKTGIRLAARRARHGAPRAKEYSILLMDFGGPPRQGGPWSFGWSIGLSDPGRGAGESLALSAAPFSRLSIFRSLPDRPDRFALSLQATAHESEAKTVFFGTPGNERGKTVHVGAATWHRELALRQHVRWRYGIGIELSNWDDDHSLLLNKAGEPIEAGFEVGALASLEGMAAIRPGLRLVVGAEKAYWRSVGLGELRLRIGVEIQP